MIHTAAVILAGSGRADGSEIHESVAVLTHLARLGVTYRCFAPDKPQADVIDHATGKPLAGQSRNCLTEAARISRGDITPLSALREADFDALYLPGGFGAAKNLCDFAAKGADCAVDPEVARAVREFHAAGKPIGLCCIAPVIAAKVLGTASGGPGVAVTLGADGPAASAVRAMGAKHVATDVRAAHADRERKVVTTGAYMFDDATPFDVFTGIGQMVETAAKMGQPSRAAAGAHA